MTTGACDGEQRGAWRRAGGNNLGRLQQMDIDDPAAQHQMGAIAAQMTLCWMSDNPGQFREPPLSALLRQAWNERYGHSGGGINYMTVPF